MCGYPRRTARSSVREQSACPYSGQVSKRSASPSLLPAGSLGRKAAVVCRPPATRSLGADGEFDRSFPRSFRRPLLEHHCLEEGRNRIPRHHAADHGLEHGRQGKVVPYDVDFNFNSFGAKDLKWPRKLHRRSRTSPSVYVDITDDDMGIRRWALARTMKINCLGLIQGYF